MSPTVILIIILLYFCVLFAVSYVAGRKADNATFFVGNRNSHWLLVAMSTICAAMSGVTFVSVPGMVGVSGWSYMQMVIGFTIGQLILAFGLVPLYYKHNLTSIYQYLQERFGMRSYRTGAWFFFVSKMLGASVRLFIVTEVLQLLVFAPLGIPYWANVVFTVAIAYLCTFKGGVKSLVWTDLLTTCCLILSVGLCVYYVFRMPEFDFNMQTFAHSPLTRVFFFDNPREGTYFWKQLVAGVVLLVGTTGIDQDLMQRTLSCRNYRESQKNILLGATVQIGVIAMFLFLGYLLYSYADQGGIDLSALKADDVFPYLATGGFFPTVVGVLFIVGFIASAYSSASGALTALTTSFTIDILGHGGSGKDDSRLRRTVHVGMAVLMALCMLVIHVLNNDSVIQTVFLVASYTYGPLLGMFCFGILTRRQVRERWVPLAALAAPVLTYIIDTNSAAWFHGYTFSHDRLLLNALLMFLFLFLLSIRRKKP